MSPTIYAELTKKAQYIKENFEAERIDYIKLNQLGSMLTFFFSKRGVIKNYSDVLSSNTDLYGKFFSMLLSNGIMLPPSQFETMFVSHAHSYKDLDETIEKCIESAKKVGKS